MQKKALSGLTGLILLFVASLSFSAEQKPMTQMEDAIIAAKKYLPGTAIKAELVNVAFEIMIQTEAGSLEKVFVNAEDGTVIKGRLVSREEAADIALKSVRGKLVSVEPEADLYKVRIVANTGTTYEVTVNAKNGEVEKKKRIRFYDEEFGAWSE
ncbi:MAG: PepSY domain-containing protein [Proteobacteria bacterium]|nr:PepSY domain-containing protein [Pseudomonadota bacterium]